MLTALGEGRMVGGHRNPKVLLPIDELREVAIDLLEELRLQLRPTIVGSDIRSLEVKNHQIVPLQCLRSGFELGLHVGVEVGQLAFVAAVLLLARGLKFLGVIWPRRMELVPAYLVGSLGAFWLLQRLALA